MPTRPALATIGRSGVLRGVVLVLALALTAGALYLIITANGVKRVDLGIVAGIWGALLGAFALHTRPADAGPSAADADTTELPGSAIEIRSASVLERAREVEARRAFEARLESLLRREIAHTIEQVVSAETASLRAEIAALRGELLEKVGGQLRLERVETTRFIGSNLEALQHEVRQLKVAQETDFTAEALTLTDAVSGRASRLRPAEIVAAPVVDPPPAGRPSSADEPPAELTVPPAGAPPTPPAAASAPPAAAPVPPAAPAGVAAADTEASVPPAQGRFDDLESLPRLTPFTEADLGPLADATPPGYRGRRRARDDDGAPDEESTGRRHRRDDAGNDLLATLLARERVR